jgi:hypothetical protein
MNMLGHYNIAQHLEPVMAAGQLKRMKEDVFAVRRREVWGPTIATEGDKVIIAFMLISLQSQWHKRFYRDKAEKPVALSARWPTSGDNAARYGAPDLR